MNHLGGFSTRLMQWFDRARRDLPWRTSPQAPKIDRPPAYHVLVSELMLQQTQVATVIPYFHRFITAFPTIDALAQAPAQEVLRQWQGLGYYSRAKNLQAAAKIVVNEFGGRLPSTVKTLLALPGIGRYTAGAVASIAFGERAPILDGNVARVLCRLDKIESDPREPVTREMLWTRTAEILPKKRVGDFNSAMMELGATVCTPRKPRCLICPVQKHCLAFEAGVQESIPAPRKAKVTPLFHRRVFCLQRSSDGRWLVEQRPSKGRWAGMWQFITIERSDDITPRRALRAVLESAPVETSAIRIRPLGTVTHALTHRRYQFEIFVGNFEPEVRTEIAPRKWLTLAELDAYPFPKPHLRIVEMIGESSASEK